MRTGAGLALICLGAILAFAVTGNISFLNVHTAGWVIMIVGVAGLVLPRRSYGWLGRRMIVRRTYPGGRIEQEPMPPYVARNPGTSRIMAGLPPQPPLLDDPDADLIDAAAEGRTAGDPRNGNGAEVIEDLYEQP
jgi:hypothetical protein